MKVLVLGETDPTERRVALVPGALPALGRAGVEVAVQSGAGLKASFTDGAYEAAGASLFPSAEGALRAAAVVLKVQPPQAGSNGRPDEVALLRPGSVVMSLLNPVANAELVQRLAEAGVTAIALDQVPRITRAQNMDVLSSQATVAGYKAVLLGANEMTKFLPMLMTAAGTIRPARALILGAGVAGLQAIATARRLGAVVDAFDVRPAVKEQVESLGANFLETELSADAEDEGGYAKELSEEQHQRELELIAKHIREADLTITTAQIPGRPAPLLITEEMVTRMRPGSVIVDLASESGGNCALTKMGENVTASGVRVMGPVNLPSALPFHASQMYAKNIATFLLEFVSEGEFRLDFENEIVSATCVAHEGKIRHAPTLEALGG